MIIYCAFLRYVLIFTTIILPICSCTGYKKEVTFRNTAEKIKQSLIYEISCIHTLDEAKIKYIKLQTLFCELSDVMIAIDQYQERYKLYWKISEQEKESSKMLLCEIERVIIQPGVKELMEKAQEKGFKRLETYLYRKKKRSERT